MTKGGNIDTNGLRRFQDGEGLLKLMGFTIYCRGNQNLIFLKTRLKNTDRSEDALLPQARRAGD